MRHNVERMLRLARALAWDMSSQRYLRGKKKTPRYVYEAQTDGCKERFRISAHELIDAIGRAGLELRVVRRRVRAERRST